MGFNINELRSGLVYGGARPNRFQVQFRNPANGVADIKVPLMVEATSIPDMSIGSIGVPYQGRIFKVAGDRAFSDWQVTILNDEDYAIRNALEEWQNKINSLQGNVRNFNTASPAEYKSTAYVTHYGIKGNIIRVYKIDGIYPTSLSGMNLDWAENDSLQKYTVNFNVDWWSIADNHTGNAGGV